MKRTRRSWTVATVTVLVGVTVVAAPVTAQPPHDDAQLPRESATFAVPGY